MKPLLTLDVDLEGGKLQVRVALQRVTVRSGALTETETSDEGEEGAATGPADAHTTQFVFAEPKTGRSRRQVAITPSAAAALRAHRARQSEERLALGPDWEDNDLVFSNAAGRPMEASNMLKRSFKPLLKKAGLPDIPFHALRHTAATLLLGRNVNPKVVSEMPGHSQVGITLNIYSHVLPDMQKDATAAMESLLAG